MKRTVMALTAAGLLLLCACHKENKEPTQTRDGYWIVATRQQNSYADTRYPIHNTTRTMNNGYAVLSGMDSIPGRPADSLLLWFRQMPVANGQYKIVRFPDSLNLRANEMGITINMASRDFYTSTGIASNKTWLPPNDAVITVTGGKIKVDIPEMTLFWTNLVTRVWDSTRLSGAVLIEK
jgi:hypothetical protein